MVLFYQVVLQAEKIKEQRKIAIKLHEAKNNLYFNLFNTSIILVQAKIISSSLIFKGGQILNACAQNKNQSVINNPVVLPRGCLLVGKLSRMFQLDHLSMYWNLTERNN